MISQNENVQVFINKVSKIYEVEFGDFRRKVSQYLQRLEQSLGARNATPANRRILGEIRQCAVYNPKPDIEFVRAEIVELANRLN